MNSSDTPSRITKAFGVNGLKNTIPVDSSTSTDNNGVATFDKGFPAITMHPLNAGGIPPSGKDINGVLYSTTLQQQWQNAGMTYPFSQDFSDAVSGYPKGAIVPSSVYTGQWLNLNEAIGTTFGAGDGSSTFALPDMRGEFVRGWDNGRGVDAGRAFGSWQKGSVIVGDDGVAGDNVASYNVADKTTVGLDLGGSEEYPISTVAASQSTLRGNGFYGYSRPRNYALLYCIKI